MAIGQHNLTLHPAFRSTQVRIAVMAAGLCACAVLAAPVSAQTTPADTACTTVECLNAQDRELAEEVLRNNRALDPRCQTAECRSTRERRAAEAERAKKQELEEARSKLAEWRLKRVQLETRQAQRRTVPRDSWPEMINTPKMQYLRQDLFSEEQEIATTVAMAEQIKTLAASGVIPTAIGMDADDGPDALAPSLRVYEKERDIARLKLTYEMDLIEAKMELELLRAIEQELIWADKVKDLTP